jgi:hypothetical protein
MTAQMIEHLEALERRLLQRVGEMENAIKTYGETIMALLDALTAQVAQNITVEQSAVTLIQGLAAQIAAAGTDPVALANLQSQLNTSATALAAAISANTPAAPPSGNSTPSGNVTLGGGNTTS